MAWQQIMPVRMNPEGKVLSGSWAVPVNTFKIAARLIMDEADRIDPTLTIRIEIINEATGKTIYGSEWQGGHLTHAGTYDPPNFEGRRYDKFGNPRDLGGVTWNFSITASRAVRYGAEIDTET
jgi:hypothetical protein